MQEKNNKFWFKRKRYGWGWGLPVSWEGWVVLLVYIFLLTRIFQSIDSLEHSGSDTFIFTARVVILSLILIAICYWKGEKPKWTWGDKE